MMNRRIVTKKLLGLGVLLLSMILMIYVKQTPPVLSAAIYGIVFGVSFLMFQPRNRVKEMLQQQARTLDEYVHVLELIDTDKQQISELLNRNHQEQEQLHECIQKHIIASDSTALISDTLTERYNEEFHQLGQTFTKLFYSYPEVPSNEPLSVENVHHYLDRLNAHHAIVKEMASRILDVQDAELKTSQKLA